MKIHYYKCKEHEAEYKFCADDNLSLPDRVVCPICDEPMIFDRTETNAVLTKKSSRQERVGAIDEKKLLRIAPKIFKECLLGR